MKNALDWVVGTGELVGKSMALIKRVVAREARVGVAGGHVAVMSACVIPAASITVSPDGRRLDANGIVGDADLAMSLRSATKRSPLPRAVHTPSERVAGVFFMGSWARFFRGRRAARRSISVDQGIRDPTRGGSLTARIFGARRRALRRSTPRGARSLASTPCSHAAPSSSMISPLCVSRALSHARWPTGQRQCPSQDTRGFQSTNAPCGLSRHAHTWSS